MARCFIAVELPEEVKVELRAIQEQIKKACTALFRWVNPDGIHLTLKFLGEVPEETIAELKRAIEEAVGGVPPFELELDGLGVFPGLRSPRVLWVGLGGNVEALKILQQNIDVSFELLGFGQENREFTAHLTLARVRDDVTAMQRQSVGTFVLDAKPVANLRFAIRNISLMRSHLMPTGAVYARLASVPLVNG